MFIAYTKDNSIYVENKDFHGRIFTWDDIPSDAKITALSLTHPVPLVIGNKRVSPKISIKRYHYYYFFNEATISIIQADSGGIKNEQAALVAKVIAGIDVERDYVLEIRLDKFGNSSVSSYPLDALKKKIKSGHMRKTILREGIPCAVDKKML